MTREEAFKKNFPEYCRGEECLSPYFDLFCAGLEIEKSQMYEKTVKPMQEQIEKAKEIIREFMRITEMVEGFEPDYSELIAKAESFLKEMNG